MSSRAVYRCLNDPSHEHRSARSAAVCDRPDPADVKAYAAWLRRSYEPEKREEAPRG